MNTDLSKLQPYPFEKLRQLNARVSPPSTLSPIALSIGEPTHATPAFIGATLSEHLDELAHYPLTAGTGRLRNAIADWLYKRFNLSAANLSAETNILPVNGTREALFALAQCVVDKHDNSLLMMPNPFYQIYEGAALLAGAEPYYMNCNARHGFLPDFDAVSTDDWNRCALLYICSPGNPTGAVMDTALLKKIIGLADKHDFIIAADECYSEIYNNTDKPPPGLLQAAEEMGKHDYERCIVFHSLSKRSNAPGLRSGFVAGDAKLIKKFRLYRTYHGCAMPVHTQFASAKAWEDEGHVIDNRSKYQQKFTAVREILAPVLDIRYPDAGFYFWMPTPIDDQQFCHKLYHQQNVTLLPGSFLSRATPSGDPGKNYVRIALTASEADCTEAADRIKNYVNTIN